MNQQPTITRFTIEQKMAEIRREIRKRKTVYHGLVAKGTMTRDQAEYQTDVMKDVLADYERCYVARQPRLDV